MQKILTRFLLLCRSHWIFIVVVTVAVISNVVWTILDQSPPLWDIAGHSQRALLFAQHLKRFEIQPILFHSTPYPPFSYVVTAVFFVLFGFHEDIPQYSLLVFLVIFLVSIYSLGLQLLKRKDLALLATVLTLFYPLLALFSRIYDLDFPLTVMVTASLALFLKTDAFRKKNWTLAFAVVLACALLTKWTAVIFLMGPILYTLFKERKNILKEKIWKNMVWCAVVTSAIAAPWYIIHAVDIAKTVVAARKNVFSVPFENLFSLGSISFYTWNTVRGMGWLLFFLFLAGFVEAVLRRSKNDMILLSWMGFAYILMTFVFYSKESRYILPLFPAVALLTVSFFDHPGKIRKKYFPILMMSVGIFFWVETSWGIHFIPVQFYETAFLNGMYGYNRITTQKVAFGFTYPTQYQLAIKDIPEAIREDRQRFFSDRKTLKILVVPNSIFLTAQQIQYYARLSGLDAPGNDFTVDYALSSKVRGKGWPQYLPQADYIITKTGDQGPAVWTPSLMEIVREEGKGDEGLFAGYELVHEWTLLGIDPVPESPLSRTARLYRKK